MQLWCIGYTCIQNVQISEAKALLPQASISVSAKLKGKIASARRQQTVFYGKKQFVNLSGLKIKRTNSLIEDIVTDPRAVQKGLIHYWKPIYSAKPQSEPDLHKLLGVFSRQMGHSFSFDTIALPEEDDYEANILAQKHSSPGPDGIPFAAYKGIAKISAAAMKKKSCNRNPQTAFRGSFKHECHGVCETHIAWRWNIKYNNK